MLIALLRLYMRTLKFNLNRQNRFLLSSMKCSTATPRFRLLPCTVSLSELCSTISFLRARQIRKLGGAAEYLIDGSKKNFELKGAVIPQLISFN